jgi:hypothetical protein
LHLQAAVEVQWSLEAAQQHRQARAYQWESAAARIHKTGDQQRYVYIIVYIYYETGDAGKPT